MALPIEYEGEGDTAHRRCCRRIRELPVVRHAEHVNRAAVVALQRDDEVPAVWREANLPRRLQKSRRVAVGETEGALRSSNRVQPSTRNAIALDVAGQAGI